MRYIGNKTKLLGFIRRVLRERNIRAGVAVDPFCGTASVARDLKRLGFSVVASDIMAYGHVFAAAYVEAVDAPADVRARTRELNQLPASPGFITEHFSAPLIGDRCAQAGPKAPRMFFTTENAARIDAMRVQLHAWRRAGEINDSSYYILLAALIEAADRVANTTGVYAAYVKSWQPNAKRALTLEPARTIRGNGCHARRSDALSLVSELDSFELLYLDPPYNARQYAGYYHVPELLALGWFDEQPILRGKTGLLPDRDKRTDWSRRHKCEVALEALLANARSKHVVMSYNAEGIIPETTIERLMKQYGLRESYRKYRRQYRRYRSDADSATRRYAGDSVNEYLYCVSR